MIQNKPSEVSDAFELLLEELEAEIDFVNKVAQKGFEDRDYNSTREAIENIAELTHFRNEVVSLRTEWDSLSNGLCAQSVVSTLPVRRPSVARLPQGRRTRQEAFFVPILEALSELGGKGRTSDVLDRVGEIMKPLLTDVDYERLASDSSDACRWRNTARWARNDMVKKGLLKRGSPYGIWEISDKGQRSLHKHRNP